MNKVTVSFGENVEVFDNVVGHQVGGGAVQIILSDGTQRIINHFNTVDVEPDEETKRRSLELAESAYNGEENAKEPKETTDKVTPIKS